MSSDSEEVSKSLIDRAEELYRMKGILSVVVRGLKFFGRRLLNRKPWKKEGEIITWRNCKWESGSTKPEYCAINYYIYKFLKEDLKEEKYKKGLEVGSGYGRITPFLSEFCEQMFAIEPNERMLEIAKKHFPTIEFRQAKAQSLPFPDNKFDLVVTRAVLQHIPPNTIDEACNEIKRVLNEDGTLLLLEDTKGSGDNSAYWVRKEKKYEELFQPLSVIKSKYMKPPAKRWISKQKKMILKK